MKSELDILVAMYLGVVLYLVKCTLIGCDSLRYLGEVLEPLNGCSTLFVIDFSFKYASYFRDDYCQY